MLIKSRTKCVVAPSASPYGHVQGHILQTSAAWQYFLEEPWETVLFDLPILGKVSQIPTEFLDQMTMSLSGNA